MADIIPSFNDFQEVIEILEIILRTINAETDVVWTRFNTPREFIDDLTDSIEKLRSGNYETLKKIDMMFGPTGTFQELSISNGWGYEYLKLSEQFDTCYEKLKKGN